ncbi:MAG: hypothetical protein C0504_07945 [Candidatus Solibacter sp.]|nr:hypothetical protein [Candidatus Solibacter sp.]
MAIRQTGAKVLAGLAGKARAKAAKAISIRLPLAGLESARRIAATEGIGCQTALKRAINEGLKKVS